MIYFVLLENITFFVLGDWGQDGSLQQQVADAMGSWADIHGCSFILSVGDNFYPNGLISSTGPQVERWHQVYSQPAIKHLRWFITLGNHDLGNEFGNPQLDLHQLEDRWFIHKHHYSFVKQIQHASILFIAFDSYAYLINATIANHQRSFIKQQLTIHQQCTWTIVFTHFPIYSVSEKNFGTLELQKSILPIIKKYNVDFYISGHDHDLEHFRDNNNITHYIVSGAGSRHPYKYAFGSATQLELLFQVKTNTFLRENGFVAMSVSQKKAVINFIDKNGSSMYTSTVHNKSN